MEVMDFPTIRPAYASVGVECNENDLLNYNNKLKRNDLSLLKNSYFHLKNIKVNKGVFYIKKRINLIEPRINQPKLIHNKANFVKFIEESTVANFNNKYNCWLYQKNKTLFNMTNYKQYSRNERKIIPIKTKTSINSNVVDSSFNKSDNKTSNGNDQSVFEKVKEISSKRNKISIKCIKN